MKKLFRNVLKKGKNVLCVLLAAAVATGSLCADSLAVMASGEERVFDIGVDAGSVTAKLDESGLLTVSGSGQIRDFTPETAPFAGESVKAVKLGADVTVVGNYTFYNCGGITGTLTLPKGLVRIGEGAFSGDSLGSAPKPELVENPFTEELVTKKKTDLEASPSPSPSLTPEVSSAPVESGPAESQPDESQFAGNQAVESQPVESQSAEGRIAENQSAAEPAETVGEQAFSDEQQTFSASRPEEESVEAAPVPTAAPTPEAAQAPAEKEPAASEAVSQAPSPAASPEVSAAPAASPAPEGTPSPEEQEKKYLIENITQQEIGGKLFYPRTDGPLFTCSPENETFRAAMQEAGYVEAERMTAAAFDCGEGVSSSEGAVVKNLPVSGGRVLLPEVLPEFSAPQGGELFSYTFGGWTESQDVANMVREPGSYFLAEERDDLYFIANWTREVLVKITVKRDGDATLFSVPEIEGYELVSFRWQACELSAEEELPADEDLLLWRDLPGETGQTYRRTAEPGDENRLFRCVVTLKKEQGFSLFALFASDENEELPLGAVRGAARAAAEGTVALDRDDYAGASFGGSMEPLAQGAAGYVTIPECGFTCSGVENLVFNGWRGNNGVIYDPGMIVNARKLGLTTLTAQWAVASVVYVKPETFSANSGSGTKNDPYQNLDDALKSPSLKGNTIYTNVIVLLDDLADSNIGLFDRVPGTFTPNGGAATITSYEPGVTSGTTYTLTSDTGSIATGGTGFILGGNIRFENIKLKRGSGLRGGDDLYAEGHRLLIGRNVEATGGLVLFGGNKESGLTGTQPEIIVESGTYAAIYGGNYQGDSGDYPATVYISGSTSVQASAEAENSGNVCGGGQQAGSTAAGSEVYISSGTVSGNVYGGSQLGDVSQNCKVVLTGTADVRGSVYGGCMGTSSTDLSGHVAGNTSVILGGSCTVGQSVYVGGENGNVNGAGTNTLEMWSGTVGGSVYGGGKNGNLAGQSDLTINGGTVSAGSVYGGGYQGSTAGTSVTLAGGTVGGSAYGGGELGAVSGSASVTVSGSEIKGNVFGGSKGESADGTVGAVGSNSSVFITGGQIGSYGSDSETALQENTGRVFGGGEYALVGGDASVEINAAAAGGRPTVGHSAYGGGSDAQVTGNSSVKMLRGTVGSCLYGGGYGLNSVSGSAGVTVEGGNIGLHVYGGGALGKVTGKTDVKVQGGEITGCVFAAGEGSATDAEAGRVSGGTSVTMSGGAVSRGVYGGGNMGIVGTGTAIPGDNAASEEGASTVMTHVVMTGGTVKRIFAGGAGKGSDINVSDGGAGDAGDSIQGAVFGSTSLEISGGTVNGNAFGGSNYAFVSGNTSVNVSGTASVAGSVFGGSNLNRDPTAGFDMTSFLVKGQSNVTVDGSQGLSIGGGVLGSGNLTRVRGKRFITIDHYTGSLTTLQRSDLVKISNSEIILKGEDDKSDDAEYGSKEFTLTRIQDLRLYKTVLTVEDEAKELGAMGNYDETLTTPSSDEGIRSTILGRPGLFLRVWSTDESTGAAAYGPVSGVFWLMMSERPTGDEGVRIEASFDSDTGDSAANTGAFLTHPDETETVLAKKIGASHSRWRLGGSTLETSIVLTADKLEGGGQNTVSQTVSLPTSEASTVYKVTALEQTGSFFLILPQESGDVMTLPAPDSAKGQTANNTFALRMDPSGDGWKTGVSGEKGAYALTELPAGETAWNNGVPGIWRRGTAALITEGGGKNSFMNFTLLYDSGYKRFPANCAVKLTFQEYPQGQENDPDAALNTVVVTVTLEGDRTGVSQSVSAAGGRTFTEIPDSAASIAITPKGAVTADFLTEYIPQAEGADNMYLNLCRLDGETAAAVNFPAGTKVVLADRSTEGQQSYYYHGSASGGEARLCLRDFNNLGASGTEYPGPTDGTSLLAEKLLFAVDFSGVTTGLTEGDYFLTLTHRADQTASDAGLARAGFTVTVPAASDYSLGLERIPTDSDRIWTVALTPQVPEVDTRYADGACVHISLNKINGGTTEAVGFPQRVSITGDGQNVLHDQNGTVSCAVPVGTASTMTFDFSALTEEQLPAGTYSLSASMVPRAGLQVGSDQGTPDAVPGPLTFTVAALPQAEVRSLSVSLQEGSQRLLDVSEGPAELKFTLRYDNLQAGDALEVDLLQKTGTTPDDSSYQPVANAAAWQISPAPGELTGTSGDLTVTVPKGQQRGTYRVKVRIVPAAGEAVEQPYNFIVK